MCETLGLPATCLLSKGLGHCESRVKESDAGVMASWNFKSKCGAGSRSCISASLCLGCLWKQYLDSGKPLVVCPVDASTFTGDRMHLGSKEFLQLQVTPMPLAAGSYTFGV